MSYCSYQNEYLTLGICQETVELCSGWSFRCIVHHNFIGLFMNSSPFTWSLILACLSDFGISFCTLSLLIVSKCHFELEAFLPYLPPIWLLKKLQLPMCLDWCLRSSGLFYRQFCSMVDVCLQVVFSESVLYTSIHWVSRYCPFTQCVWASKHLYIESVCSWNHRPLEVSGIERWFFVCHQMFRMHWKQHLWKVFSFHFCPACSVQVPLL